MLEKHKVKEVMSEDIITVTPEEDVVFAFEIDEIQIKFSPRG